MISKLIFLIYVKNCFSAGFVIGGKANHADPVYLRRNIDEGGGRNAALMQLHQSYDLKLKPICLPEDQGKLSAGYQVEFKSFYLF